MVYKVGDEELEAIRKVVNSYKFDRYIDGDKSVTSLVERDFAKKIGSKYCLAVSSGTAALICGLAGMEVGPGDEVILPSYTYIATALAVLAVGAIPVIVEIDESLTISPQDVRNKITPKTKAIIPVHMRGLPCNMSEIMSIAQEHKILVIEDVAQACGGSYKGIKLGAFGDAGMFSFNHYKIISCGEGGALVTNNLKLYQRAIIQHHGGWIYEVDAPNLQIESFAGWNFRLSEISSAMLSVQLSRLDNILGQLRAEKNLLLERMRYVSNTLQASHIHDIKGDCASNVFFLMESSEQAKKFVKRANELNIDVWCAHTKGHVYSDWEPILEQRGAHHTLRDVFQINKDPNLYHPNMCPNSLDILSRTIGISTRVDRSPNTLNEMINMLIKITKEVE